jgi:polyisoprenyl-teichoic acid--peptidoglycan teichoic acid transferase
MAANKKIWIWIAVVALIGIALLMVACETGVFIPENTQQPATNQQQNNTSLQQPDALGQGNQQLGTQTVGEAARLTAGKQYSSKLVEEGTKNVLIIGEDKLNNLYDTICIASIDQKNKTLKLIMIPRDVYIEYNQDVISRIPRNLVNEPGIYKINYTHTIGSKIEYKGKFTNSGPISFLAEVIYEKFGISIDDYVKVNTKGFRALINHLGGVDINVPYDMDYDDPTQDLAIHIKKGMRHLDGTDAEGFVRFRQGYRADGTLLEIGDVGRKKNQLNFIKALMSQKGTLGNIGKVPGMIDIMGKNVQHSIGLGDILQTYMGLARYIITDKYEITTENLTSEKLIRINGSSYMVLD